MTVGPLCLRKDAIGQFRWMADETGIAYRSGSITTRAAV
jgi:hypothetical protein